MARALPIAAQVRVVGLGPRHNGRHAMESFQKCIDKLLDAVNMTRHYLAFFLVGALSFVLSLSRDRSTEIDDLRVYLSK